MITQIALVIIAIALAPYAIYVVHDFLTPERRDD